MIQKYFTDIWFFDVYNYSFVNQELMEKLGMSVENLVPLKNYLSEEATHMRSSLIPNLMKWLEDNIRERKNMKLFQLKKFFLEKILKWVKIIEFLEWWLQVKMWFIADSKYYFRFFKNYFCW